jgi:hypothetical protein
MREKIWASANNRGFLDLYSLLFMHNLPHVMSRNDRYAVSMQRALRALSTP